MKVLGASFLLDVFMIAGCGIAVTVLSLHPHCSFATSAIIQDASSESGDTASLARTTALRSSSAFLYASDLHHPAVAGDHL